MYFQMSGRLQSWPSEKLSSFNCCSRCKSLWIKARGRRLRLNCLYKEYKVAVDCKCKAYWGKMLAGVHKIFISLPPPGIKSTVVA